MIRKLTLILLMALALLGYGQNLEVKSFTAQPFDISARTHEQLDRNGKPCALVKVELPVEGCKFEGNVIHSAYDVNEYWVYLSGGTKRFDIKCPGMVKLVVNFAGISDIQSLEGGVTYVLELTGFDTQAKAPADPGMNFMMVSVEPADAPTLTVRIDGQLQAVEGGKAVALLGYGEHTYTVEANGYDARQGVATVSAGDRTEVVVRLQSQMARLTVNPATPDAVISVNSQRKGTGSWSGELVPGNYLVEVQKDGYRPYSEMITLGRQENRLLDVAALQPITGSLSVNYRPVGAKISIDGRDAGTSPAMMRDLLTGSHTIGISHDGYEKAEVTVTIKEGETATLDGSLNKIASSSSSVNTTSVPTSVPTSSAAGSGARTQAKNLDLCAMRDGRPYFFNAAEWKALPASEQARYDKKGVVVTGKGEEFVLSLNCSAPMTWNEAVKKYGEQRLPGEAQCRAIDNQYKAINTAIKSYGGEVPDEYRIWGKSIGGSSDSSGAWYVNMSAGGVYGEYKTGSFRVRTVEPIYKPSESTSSTGTDARTQARNLDLCAMRDGRPYFFNAAEWKALSASAQAKYDKKGVVVIGNGEEFVLSLNCSEPMTWNEAVSKYGEDRLPGEAQCLAIGSGKEYEAINKAIKLFGGKEADVYWYWGKSYDSSSASTISLQHGGFSNSNKSGSNRVRPVAPLSHPSAIATL